MHCQLGYELFLRISILQNQLTSKNSIIRLEAITKKIKKLQEQDDKGVIVGKILLLKDSTRCHIGKHLDLAPRVWHFLMY